MHKRLIAFFILTALLTGLLSGCYDAREIDDEVYAISIGIDKGVDNKLRLTIQYPSYKKSGGGQGSTGAESGNLQEGNIVHSIEAPTYQEALDMFGMVISRSVSLMHAKWVVFSEEMAKESITGYLSSMARFRETRPTMAIVICRGKAEDFIMENKTYIGSSISKAIELTLAQTNISGFFPAVSLFDFYKNMLSDSKQPIALYGGMNNFKNYKDETKENPPLITGQGFLPGDIPRTGVKKIELAGLSVFNKGKMVGALDSYETTYYLMLTGDFKNGKVSIPDKYSPQDSIIFNVHTGRKPKVKAYFKDGLPIIDLKVVLETEITAIQSRINYDSLFMTGEVEKQLKDFILTGMQETIRKTQKELNADIFGFGEYLAGNFYTIQEWEAYNWFSHYKEATINVDLDINVRRTGLLFNSYPISPIKIGKEEGEK